MPRKAFLKPVVPANYIEIDFTIYGPIEYPFIFVPVLHMDCLVCKNRMPAVDFHGKGRYECPICDSRTAKNMWQRIFNFVKEAP